MSREAAASLLLSLLASVAEADLLPRLLWLPNWDSPSVYLRTPATVSECAGRYDLVQDRKANGASLWLKPVDPFFGKPGGWIFRTETGEWMVSWIEAEQDDFQKSEGCMASQERDAASPMDPQDWITRHGATWHEENGAVVLEIHWKLARDFSQVVVISSASVLGCCVLLLLTLVALDQSRRCKAGWSDLQLLRSAGPTLELPARSWSQSVVRRVTFRLAAWRAGVLPCEAPDLLAAYQRHIFEAAANGTGSHATDDLAKVGARVQALAESCAMELAQSSNFCKIWKLLPVGHAWLTLRPYPFSTTSDPAARALLLLARLCVVIGAGAWLREAAGEATYDPDADLLSVKPEQILNTCSLATIAIAVGLVLTLLLHILQRRRLVFRAFGSAERTCWRLLWRGADVLFWSAGLGTVVVAASFVTVHLSAVDEASQVLLGAVLVIFLITDVILWPYCSAVSDAVVISVALASSDDPVQFASHCVQIVLPHAAEGPSNGEGGGHELSKGTPSVATVVGIGIEDEGSQHRTRPLRSMASLRGASDRRLSRLEHLDSCSGLAALRNAPYEEAECSPPKPSTCELHQTSFVKESDLPCASLVFCSPTRFRSDCSLSTGGAGGAGPDLDFR